MPLQMCEREGNIHTKASSHEKLVDTNSCADQPAVKRLPLIPHFWHELNKTQFRHGGNNEACPIVALNVQSAGRITACLRMKIC